MVAVERRPLRHIRLHRREIRRFLPRSQAPSIGLPPEKPPEPAKPRSSSFPLPPVKEMGTPMKASPSAATISREASPITSTSKLLSQIYGVESKSAHRIFKLISENIGKDLSFDRAFPVITIAMTPSSQGGVNG